MLRVAPISLGILGLMGQKESMSRGRVAWLWLVCGEKRRRRRLPIWRANGAWVLGCFLGVAETTARAHGGNEVETAAPTPFPREMTTEGLSLLSRCAALRCWACLRGRQTVARQPLSSTVSCHQWQRRAPRQRAVNNDNPAISNAPRLEPTGVFRPSKPTGLSRAISLARPHGPGPWPASALIVSLPFTAARDWPPLGLARLSRTPSSTLTLPGQLQCKRASSPACSHPPLPLLHSRHISHSFKQLTHQQTIAFLYNKS